MLALYLQFYFNIQNSSMNPINIFFNMRKLMEYNQYFTITLNGV